MQRLIVVLLSVIVLVACGSTEIHEDIDEELASDALQLMEVVTKNVEKDILYEDEVWHIVAGEADDMMELLEYVFAD